MYMDQEGGINFNPRSYKRSDPDVFINSAFIANFNPRSYKRSDHGRDVFINRTFYFNPRSYKRSDIQDFLMLYQYFQISIHAPTRGATAMPCDCIIARIFQSTLLQEERRK